MPLRAPSSVLVQNQYRGEQESGCPDRALTERTIPERVKLLRVRTRRAGSVDERTRQHASSKRTGLRRLPEEERPVRLPGRPAGRRRHRRAHLPGADPRHRRAVRHAARPRLPRRDDVPLAEHRRAGVHVVPGARTRARSSSRSASTSSCAPTTTSASWAAAPDFMNQFVTGWHLMADRFARAGARFGENATRYYEHVREHDLFLTHMLINPQIDRSKTSAQQEDPFLHLGRVRETRRRHRRARGQDARHHGADHRGGRGDSRSAACPRATTPTRWSSASPPTPRASSSSAGRRWPRCRARASTIRCRAASRRWTASRCSTTCWCPGTGCSSTAAPGSGEIINTLRRRLRRAAQRADRRAHAEPARVLLRARP